MSISTNAMVVNVSISMWNGYRIDKSWSAEITADANAAADAARVNQHLIPRESLAPIITAAGAIRTHLYAHTLPWKDNGDRLLPRDMYMDFIHAHSEHVARFDSAVADFVDTEYPVIREKAAFRMGEKFNADFYPMPETIRPRFKVTLGIDAVATSQDFRVEMDEDHAAEIRAGIDAAIEARVAEATREPWRRLYNAMERVSAALAPAGRLRDATFTNVTELLQIIPGLNITNDPEIIGICDGLKTIIDRVDTKVIKKDDALRAELSSEALGIMDTMRYFMDAMKDD